MGFIMKKILLMITFLSLNAWSQEPAVVSEQPVQAQDTLKNEPSFENAPTGQLRHIAQATNTVFVPQSLIPDEGLLVVQPSLYMPDRKKTSERKVFSVNQSTED